MDINKGKTMKTNSFRFFIVFCPAYLVYKAHNPFLFQTNLLKHLPRKATLALFILKDFLKTPRSNMFVINIVRRAFLLPDFKNSIRISPCSSN